MAENPKKSFHTRDIDDFELPISCQPDMSAQVSSGNTDSRQSLLSAQVSSANTDSWQSLLSAKTLDRSNDEIESRPSALAFKYANMSQLVKGDTTNLGRLGIQQPFKGELEDNVKTSGLLNELLIEASDEFLAQITKLFHSFSSAKSLGAAEPHSNLRDKVISLSKELYNFLFV